MELKPAYTLTLDQLAALFNEAFAGYIGGSVQFNAASLAGFLARDSVDLNLSQIFLRDDQPVGFGYVARQGGASRLAAFGVIPSASGQGIGKAAMTEMIAQARVRGDQRFELEVIEQNPRAVKLYEGVGFKIIRRLVGYTGKNPPGVASPDLAPLDLYEAATAVVAYGARDLPWQVDGVTMLRLSPPTVAYRLAEAVAILSDPTAEAVSIRSLVVLPEHRRQGQATRLLSALFAQFPGKTWSLSPIYPEEYAAPLAAHFAFERTPISQWQMRLGFV